MPELPEVETTRRKIEPLLVGRVLTRIEHDAPHKYTNTHRAEGRTVTSIGRRGKYLLLQLAAGEAAGDALSPEDSGPLELLVHLGMTGGFRLEAGAHTRVTLHTDAGAVYFNDARKFGKVAVVRPGEYAAFPTLHGMGPEPLSDDFKEADFVKLAAQAGAVKPWLLSQKPVSGVGNIYADESLWMSRLHPAQTKLKPAEARTLYASIREVMAAAVAAGGSTLSDGTYQQHDGEAGSFQLRHHAYARGGTPCDRCGVMIEKIVLAQRGTHFCPHCQVLRAR